MDDVFRDIGKPDADCSVGQILNDYFQTDGEPPEPSEKTVYHYTSLAVLNEMCKESGDFFATHFMSLNDTHEFFLGVQIALEQLANCPTLPVKIRNNYPSFQNDARDNIVWLLRREGLSPWIVSFSKDPDSLSQWVAYTDRVQGGVAVGTFLWNIPWEYSLDGDTHAFANAVHDNHISISPTNATLTVSKGNVSDSVSVSR